MLFYGYQLLLAFHGSTLGCPLLVFTLLTYRKFLGFVNVLSQRAVTKYLIYINQISRKDFVSSIGFNNMLYKMLASALPVYTSIIP